jgi:hypothetical protein
VSPENDETRRPRRARTRRSSAATSIGSGCRRIMANPR